MGGERREGTAGAGGKEERKGGGDISTGGDRVDRKGLDGEGRG